MNAQPAGLSHSEIERLADIIMMMQRCFVQHLSEELSRGQVSFPQYFLLGHISSSESLSMTEIADKMAHTTAAATGLVDRLENLGYVRRMHASNDRRKVLVRITPKGVDLVGRIRQDIVAKLSVVTGILKPQEQTTWLHIYEKIHAHITCPQ
ncbi:MAG: MarR family transcriptional regulator [Verrucomicrobiota bacterium]|jgi:DNA-binding MarR family transcriptional regulator